MATDGQYRTGEPPLPGSQPVSRAPMDLVDLGLRELASEIRRGTCSCRDVVSAYLAQIARLNPAVNAIVSLRDPDVLLAEADTADLALRHGDVGVLHGVPIAVKDLALTRGLRTTFGSPSFADHVP